MPDELEDFVKRGCFAKAFADGMKSQLANTAYRVRKGAAANILKGLKVPKPSDPTKRVSVGVAKLNTSEPEYSIFNVPFLHGNESSLLDYDELFRHPLMLKYWDEHLFPEIGGSHYGGGVYRDENARGELTQAANQMQEMPVIDDADA
ncbi:hypothetical protein HMN09_01238700 [Mycena chlorophos]|uniref:Uncharacterized protein n=1 Tax=Mycena chlorophos TaxID=658473 RepID=A0A8H6VXH6_MYCCL|nr:hypothetical protein HMN09_01238700 [Mycena chlorophos]